MKSKVEKKIEYIKKELDEIPSFIRQYKHAKKLFEYNFISDNINHVLFLKQKMNKTVEDWKHLQKIVIENEFIILERILSLNELYDFSKKYGFCTTNCIDVTRRNNIFFKIKTKDGTPIGMCALFAEGTWEIAALFNTKFSAEIYNLILLMLHTKFKVMNNFKEEKKQRGRPSKLQKIINEARQEI